MVAFRVIDKRGIEAIFFTREEFQLLQQWLPVFKEVLKKGGQKEKLKW